MALATRCPACSTIFRISTAQAAAKGGMVRCGQCSNIFNSLDALVRVEDLDVLDETVVTTVVLAGDPVVDVDESASVPTFEPTPPSVQSGMSTVDAALSTPQPVPVGGEWWLPDPSVSRGSGIGASPENTGSSLELASERPGSVVHDPVSPTPSIVEASDALSPWGSSESGTGPVFMQPPARIDRPTRAARWTWGLLSLAALLLLSSQVAYLWRDEIAVRWSPSKPWLIAACTAVGCKVDYPAHAESITIESANIQMSAADANLYSLTALLRNRDMIDIRYPYLELLLTDLQDKVIVRRVLRPEDYLVATRDGSGLASPGFAAQSELPIRLTFELNALRFAGYRLEKFYP